MDPKVLAEIKRQARLYADETMWDPTEVDHMLFENAMLRGFNMGLEHAKKILTPEDPSNPYHYPLPFKAGARQRSLFRQIQKG